MPVALPRRAKDLRRDQRFRFTLTSEARRRKVSQCKKARKRLVRANQAVKATIVPDVRRDDCCATHARLEQTVCAGLTTAHPKTPAGAYDFGEIVWALR